MPGAVFYPGQTEIRPGVYVNVQNQGEQTPLTEGIVASIFRSSWGPLNVPTPLYTLDQVENTFWTSGNIDTAKEAFKGGAQQVLAYRLGASGVAATATLKDTTGTPVDVLTITAIYSGTRGNNLTISVKNALADSSQRQCWIYEGTTLRQTFTYTVTNSDEAASFVAALTAAGSSWITASKIAVGSGVLADATNTALSGGTDPTVTGTEWTAALNALVNQSFNVLCIDAEDNATQLTVQAWVDQQRNLGQRIMAVVGEPTSISLSTRQLDAKTFNDPAVVYVANGFTRLDTDGTTKLTIEGHSAAARVAGMIAGNPITTSLTHLALPDATGLVGALADGDIQVCIANGALVFSLNARGQVIVEYGITTLVTPPANLDNGWKKIRRVRTRDFLMSQVAANWDDLVGRVNNNPDGQSILIANAQSVINDLIAQGALLDGSCSLDPANPPSGDSAWFVISVDDVDAAEHLYLTFGFQFSAT